MSETTALSAGEREELERLRGEVEALRAARSRINWKAFAAGVLIVLGCALAPVSLATVWVHNQVADTDRFVTTVSPLIREPSVRAALSDRVTDTIFSHIDVQGLANQAVDALAAQGVATQLTEVLHGLTGPLATSVRSFVHTRVTELLASQQIAQAFENMIRVAHRQADAVLAGEASAVSIQGADVRLDLGPFIDAAKQQLIASGLTIASRVPEVHPTITVANAADLVRAQLAYTMLDRLATWLPLITLILLAAGIYLARGHRRALLGAGLGVAASMLVLTAALAVARVLLVGSVPSRSAAPAAASYEIVVRFLREGLRTLLVLGLVVALGAFLAGPSVTAVRIRGAVVRSMAWLRERASRAGLRTGKVGGWVHTYRGALRGAAIGLAVLIFVFLDRPSGLAVLMIGLLVAVCLVVIQFLDQPSGKSTG